MQVIELPDVEKKIDDFLVPGFLRKNYFRDFPKEICVMIMRYFRSSKEVDVVMKDGDAYMYMVGYPGLIYLSWLNKKDKIVPIPVKHSISEVIPGVELASVNFFIKTDKGQFFFHQHYYEDALDRKPCPLTRLILEFMPKYAVCDISVGDRHGVFLTKQGRAYVWGDNWYGQLGIGSKEIKEIKDLKMLEECSIKKRVKTVWAVGNRTFIEIDENNVRAIYGAGDNRVGQLGSGKEDSCFYSFCKTVFDVKRCLDGARVKKIVGTTLRTFVILTSKRKDTLYLAGRHVVEGIGSRLFSFKKISINNKWGDGFRIHNVSVCKNEVTVAVIFPEKQADTRKVVLEYESHPANCVPSVSLVRDRIKDPAIYDVVCDERFHRDFIITRSREKFSIYRGSISSLPPLTNFAEFLFHQTKPALLHNTTTTGLGSRIFNYFFSRRK